jgi:hypothetical protein
MDSVVAWLDPPPLPTLVHGAPLTCDIVATAVEHHGESDVLLLYLRISGPAGGETFYIVRVVSAYRLPYEDSWTGS